MRRLLRADLLLPLVIVAAALALAASDLMATFELTPPGREPIDEQLGGDRHGYAMLLLGAFTLVTLTIAVATGQRAPAWATAGLGIAALVLFLIVDLPDAGDTGEIEIEGIGLAGVEVVAQPGFWLGAAAALTLALAGIAYASQSAEDRTAPRRLWAARRSSSSRRSDPSSSRDRRTDRA
ncbi:MAG TPA: hypothetical protein VFH44_11500 [Solirubrobacterales bacterium]|nr:hypothetical protein [Solirubrobacterales bacterium]